tara:strand:+ start:3328 stop:4758 length:1431 start_codon:yes stop_codon:yes gene_type:complete
MPSTPNLPPEVTNSIQFDYAKAQDIYSAGVKKAVAAKEFAENAANRGGLESGPLSDLENDKHGYTSVEFPEDVQGPGQRHFIKFNIVTVRAAEFGVPKSSTEIPTETETGQSISSLAGGLLGGAIDEALGGSALAAMAGGASTTIATNVFSQISESTAVSDFFEDDGLGGEALAGLSNLGTELSTGLTSLGNSIKGALPEGVNSTFGKLGESAAKMKESVLESVPIEKDSLNFGSFLGSIGAGLPQELSSIVGGGVQSQGDIILYVPFSITEQYQANWQGGEMGGLAAVAKTAKKAYDGGLANLAENAKQAGSDLGKEGLRGLAEAGGAKLGSDFLQKKADKMLDQVVNPYFELFFEKVGPRTFTFDFKMAPKNKSEAEAIQTIVQLFKMYSAPTLTPLGNKSLRFWGYPAMFEIEYWNADLVHKIKPCALTSIAVNYSASGSNHTFYDGRPLQTDLTLNFMESELITREGFREGY